MLYVRQQLVRLACCAALTGIAAHPSPVSAAGNAKAIPFEIEKKLSSGIPQELIVLYDDADIEAEAAALRAGLGLAENDRNILTRKSERFREIKSRVETDISDPDMEALIDYDQLPMRFSRFRSLRALRRLLSDKRVMAVYENLPVYRQLAESLPLIRQPAMSTLGYKGAGSTVAILDTGVNYTLPDFGSCTSPGVPAGCRVIASVDIATNDYMLDDSTGHGTNVAGIVAGVAPDSKIAMLDIFEPNGTSSEALVISGINWVIANQSVYNIKVVNMSLGNGLKYTSLCSNKATNPFVTPVANARAAGIMPVAASGNEMYIDGISRPACTPGVMSVGAVYDSNVGGLKWGTDPNSCTDLATSADMVACFSNSSSFMTMLAPGAMITAAGITKGGTSQATPHVSGAVAVLRSAFPSETLDQITARLTSYGKTVTDPRNGMAKPRLDLLASLGPPANDMFAARTLISGDIARIQTTNASASAETGEPLHAGKAGGRSVWWGWTPARSGVASIDTHGSDFDTLLAVYTGTLITSLAQVAANDNDGTPGGTSSVSFNAVAGREYLIAVDGASGASGLVNLAVSNAMSADLSLSSSLTASQIIAGKSTTFSATVTNLGPSDATNTKVTITLPSTADVVSVPLACTTALPTVTCNAGTLASQARTTFDIVISSKTAGQLTIQGSASSDTSDPVPSNNSVTASITVTDPPLPVPALSRWIFMLAALFPAASGLLRTKPGSTQPDAER